MSIFLCLFIFRVQDFRDKNERLFQLWQASKNSFLYFAQFDLSFVNI